MIDEQELRKKVKKHWNDFKKVCHQKNIHMSERIAAEQIGITQGAFNQFLNRKKVKLSERFLYRFALLVGVSPASLIPELNKINMGVGIDEN